MTDWPALMRLAHRRLGLAPEAFWRLSPRELTALLGDDAPPPLTREGLTALAARFPDEDFDDERS